MILNETNRIKTKILNLIMTDPSIIEYFKEKYVDDDIWKFCIERDPSLFKKMKHPSYDLCLYACEVDGSNLKYVKNKFTYIKITDVMVLTAVKSNPKAILCVPKKLLNFELEEMAFDKDPSLMAYFDYIRPEYMKKVLDENPYTVKYLLHILDENTICVLIKRNPQVCTYIDHMTDRMLDTLRENYPDIYNLYSKSMTNC